VKYRPALCCLLAWLATASASLASELGPGVEEVQRCIERNLPEHSSRQSVVFERRDRAGNERRFEARVWWKRDPEGHSRLLARVEAPPDERGTAFLMIEDVGGTEMFSYLPELGRVRRVTSRSANSFLGTDLSYEDVEELQAVAKHARVERLPDTTLAGRPVYVLASTPDAASQSAYQRIVSQVDRETCVVLHTSLQGIGDRVLKELIVDFPDVEKEGQRWLPRKVRLRHLANESETRLTLEKIELEPEIPDRLFTQSELAKGH
jgi:outer membrane lipoprotein-sorting protein